MWKKGPPTAGRYRFCWVSQGHFKNILGEDPQTPIRPSLLLSCVSTDRPPSLTLVWIRAWNTIEHSDSAGSLLCLSTLLGQGHGSKFLRSHFQNIPRGGPQTPRTHTRPSLLLGWGSPDRTPSLTLVWSRAWKAP